MNNLKRVLCFLLMIIMVTTLIACGGNEEVVEIIDYADAESFEAALNNGENLEGKIVQFIVDEIHPESKYGFNLWAGNHLNFVSSENPNVIEGGTVVVRVTEIENVSASWIIRYEKVDNAVIDETTISSSHEDVDDSDLNSVPSETPEALGSDGLDNVTQEESENVQENIIEPEDDTEEETNIIPEEQTEAEPEVQEPEPQDQTNNATMGQRNALASARQYLSIMSFSYSGLISQLEYEQYTHEEAVYAADNCGADWFEQALKKAKEYLRIMSFSRDGLIGQLEYEGFEHEEAVYAVDNCEADWFEQAAKKAEEYLRIMSFSRDGLIDQLEYEGFTNEQAVYGVEANGY